MNYRGGRAKIRQSYLQSRLELELAKSRDLDYEIDNVTEEIWRMQNENLHLNRENTRFRFKALSSVRSNCCTLNEIRNIINIMNNRMITEDESNELYLKNKKTVVDQCETMRKNLKSDSELSNGLHYYENVRDELNESIDKKKTEIAEFNVYANNRKKEWTNEIHEKEGMLDLLRETETQQRIQMNKNPKFQLKTMKTSTKDRKTAVGKQK